MKKLTSQTVSEAFHYKTGIKLGRKIYSGNGDIYHLIGYCARLVKIDHSYRTFNELKEMKSIVDKLKYLHKQNNPSVVKLYDVGTFKHSRNGDVHHAYYYIMEKLNLLPHKGRWHLVSDLRATIESNIPLDPAHPRKFHRFIERAQQLSLIHSDLHEYNLMVDKKGTPKFIDLESFW